MPNQRSSLSLHDGELINISIDRDNSVARLSFRLENNELHTAELVGLKVIRCTDLTVQNVVNRVLLSSEKDLSPDGLSYWINWMTRLSDAPAWLSEKGKLEWLSQLRQGKLDLVVFEPSSGAEIAGLCERFVIIQVQEAPAHTSPDG